MRILIALLLVAGCAKSAAQPGFQSGGPATASELDSLERELDISEQKLGEQIDLRLGALQSSRSKAEASEARGDDKDEAAAERREAPPNTPAPEPAAETAPATQAPSDEPMTQESPCDRACRALGSMRRSAERICLIAGAQVARCTRARERVRGAETRVSGAGCSCPDEGSTDGGAQPSRK